MRNITFITGTLHSVAHMSVKGQPLTLFVLENDGTLVRCKALGETSERAREIFKKGKVISVVGAISSKVKDGEILQTGIDVHYISEGEQLTPDGVEDVYLSDVINAIYNVPVDEYPAVWTPLMISFFTRAGNLSKSYLRGRWGMPK